MGNNRVLKIVDLFCGAGGLSEGFRQAGCEIIAGSDNDPDAMATYAHNFPEAVDITGDVRETKVKKQILEFAKGVDILIGGPPCQAFSQVRNHARLIDDPRNSLYKEFVQILARILPAAFVMENVTGLDQIGAKEQIISDLKLGDKYSVRVQILDAAEFGVPQTRKRMIFIGIRSSLGVQPPEIHGSGATEALTLVRSSKAKYRVRDTRIKALSPVGRDLYPIVTASEALSDLESLVVGNRVDSMRYDDLPEAQTDYQKEMRQRSGFEISNVQVPRMNADTALRLSNIPPGGNYRDLDEQFLERYLSGQKWGPENGSGKLSRKHFYAYRRLHPDIWSWTLNTKADSVYHYSVPRALSVREFARLQSFPDRFTFKTDSRPGMIEGRHSGGPAHSRYRQVGNAVPPLLARAVATQIVACLRSSQGRSRSLNGSTKLKRKRVLTKA